MSNKTIYLDYAAATPLDQRVFKAMQPYFSEAFYNPSAPYQPARVIKQAVEAARANCASQLGAKPAEIIFTAGSTESINLAFNGVLQKNGHCVVSASEHMSVLETARGFDHAVAKVDKKGRVVLENLFENIRDDTKLVSIGMVNNETGVVQDIKRIAALLDDIRKQRKINNNQTPLYFHTDATQAAGYLDLSATRLGVDLLTLGGNKIYGPKQTGLLYKRSSVKLAQFIRGSGQEQNLRSGTENVPGIIGLSKAFEIAAEDRQKETARLQKLKTLFVKQLVEYFPEAVIVGDQKHASPHIVMATWRGLDGERLVFGLESYGVLVNTGAACAAKKEGVSHVLKAMDLSPDVRDGSLRFSFGRDTTENDILEAVKIIRNVINKERS